MVQYETCVWLNRRHGKYETYELIQDIWKMRHMGMGESSKFPKS